MPTNALNQYTALNGDVLLYDTNGNLTTQGLTASYSFDSKNRLLAATKGSNTMTVAYDYRNRPVSRTINGTTTYFIYDNWSLIAEYSSTGALLAKYIHGPIIDEILAKMDTSGTIYYHQDGLGSTVALTSNTGVVLESYQYDVFGAVSIFDASGATISNSAFAIRHLYTGREYLESVALYDYRNRVYSATLGRFIQSDPIRFDAGDVNLYRYVENDTVNYYDPYGESAVQVIAGLLLFVIIFEDYIAPFFTKKCPDPDDLISGDPPDQWPKNNAPNPPNRKHPNKPGPHDPPPYPNRPPGPGPRPGR